MTTGSICRRYAKALLEIGEEKGNLLGILREVQRAADVWAQSEDLRIAMTNPLVDIDARRNIWQGVTSRLGISPIGKNFMNLIFDKSRCAQLPGIARELGVFADKQQNRLRADVTSAEPLSEDATNRLKAALQRQTGKMIVVTKREDPGLLGGVVTKIGDMLYDGSLKTQLARMRDDMLGRG
jgi:F-type H+-transporting ATPase subunit delta